MTYRFALERGRSNLVRWLSADALNAIQVGLDKIQTWYPTSCDASL
jgi:hypothetical protein